MERINTRSFLLVLTAGCIAGSAAAWDETHVYGIAEFGDSGECGSSGMTHKVHTKTAGKFADHFDDLMASGDWDDVDTRNNKSARGSYYTDSTKAASCSCTADDVRGGYGADEPDVFYVHTHGGHRHSDWSSSLSMGNSSYDCTVRTTENMLWNSDTEIAVIKACQGGNYDVWQNGGYRPDFTNSGSSFTMWNAFHGNSSCGSHVKSYVKRYARDSDWNGVGENWIDEAYDKDWGSNNDDCPVSIVMGSNSSDRETMFEYGGWRDRKNTGSKTGSTIFYVSGCDPSDGATLP